jgi:AraC family transcriptional regulator of adaptative response / DNA-3-methyladenine glycosylase II
VAFAAGFSSVRQFNDTVRIVFATTPSELRKVGRQRRSPDIDASGTPGTIALRLPARQPFAGDEALTFLGARAVPGVESWDGITYARSLDLPHGDAVVSLRAGANAVHASLRLVDLRDLAPAVHRVRRLLDLDADPVAIDAHLADDPQLAELVAKQPGRRLPGAVDGAEMAVRAMLGQQVSVAGARTIAARLAAAHGRTLDAPDGNVTKVFPSAGTIAALSPNDFPMPATRARSILSLAAALADGVLTLDPGVDRERAEADLLRQPGVGPWTASYLAMRALGDPDAFVAGDLGVRRGVAWLTGASQLPSEREATAAAEPWRPWRAYAVMHLWSVRSPTTSQEPS